MGINGSYIMRTLPLCGGNIKSGKVDGYCRARLRMCF